MKLATKVASTFLGLGLAITLTAFALESKPAPSAVAEATTDANITRLTARLLERSQFSHHPLDKELAGKFLDRYLDTLDGGHFLFLQADVKDFDGYREMLSQATRKTGDTAPAKAMFDRYIQRLIQRTEFATNLLKTEKFDFTGKDSYMLDREHAARPVDLNAAHDLWREQVRFEYLQEKLNDKKPDEIVKTLSTRYSRQLQTMKKLTHDEVLEVYLNALAHVYDPHSDYMGHEQMDDFGILMNLSLFGIGATLQSEDGYCKIHELVPGGPAAKSNLLKPGDRIVAVSQGSGEPVDIVDMPLNHAVQLIRGPKGTVVRLAIISGKGSDSVRKTITLIRDEIKLEDEQAKAKIIDLPDGNKTMRLGVLDLPSFYADFNARRGQTHRSASTDVAELITKLKAENINGLVLDLRRNGGGSLEEAINLTGLFIHSGPVVQTRTPDGDVDVDSDTDPAVLYDGPLVVLTSRFSASASEILAGALQDYGRAVIVGDASTFGKGTVQSVLPLLPLMDENNLKHSYDPGALKITIRKFYRPSGASTQLKGVASDIVLPSLSGVSDVSESALKDPLPWDTIPAAKYDRLDRVKPCLASLERKSAARMTSEKDFVYLRDDVARFKKSVDEKTVSLNEADRRKEIADNKARIAARDAERLAAHSSMPATYEITLKNTKLAGLPPAMTFTNAVAKPSSDSSTTDDEGLSAAVNTPQNDVILTEAERILEDYAGMMNHKSAPAVSVR